MITQLQPPADAPADADADAAATDALPEPASHPRPDAAGKKLVRDAADKLALRGVALTAVANRLHDQQKMIEATGTANMKTMARMRQTAMAAIRRAKALTQKHRDDIAPVPPAPVQPTADPKTPSADVSAQAASSRCPLGAPAIEPAGHDIVHSTLAPPISVEKPAALTEAAAATTIELGSLVRVATEDAAAEKFCGAWGTVKALLTNDFVMFADESGTRGTLKLRRVPRAWCELLQSQPTPSLPWKKNVGWLQEGQKEAVNRVWLPVPLDTVVPTAATQLAESEVAAGCAEILWRLRVKGVVVAPPALTSMVARHVVNHWAAHDRRGEGEELVEELLHYGRRAHLLLLPILSESHWTLLALGRQREPETPALEALLSSDAGEASAITGCDICRSGGCLRRDVQKATTHVVRIEDEQRALDPVGQCPPLENPPEWSTVRCYDTLDTASTTSAKLAVGLLEALQTIGVHHHLQANLLVTERAHTRRQTGVTCGFWVLHYVEEEMRRWAGEGRFSFAPDLRQRLSLLNGFAARLRCYAPSVSDPM